MDIETRRIYEFTGPERFALAKYMSFTTADQGGKIRREGDREVYLCILVRGGRRWSRKAPTSRKPSEVVINPQSSRGRSKGVVGKVKVHKIRESSSAKRGILWVLSNAAHRVLRTSGRFSRGARQGSPAADGGFIHNLSPMKSRCWPTSSC
jgi:hypothetical protein